MDVLGYGAVVTGIMYGMLRDPFVWTYLGCIAAAAFQTESRALVLFTFAAFAAWDTATLPPTARLFSVMHIGTIAAFATYGLLIFALSRLVRFVTPARSTSDS